MNRESTGITVVVPSFNHGRFIDAAIDSILEQNYPNVEIMVIDGGSTDDTVDRLRSFGDKIRWVSEKDDGQSDAIIKGVAATKNKWVTWLNSDDVQSGDALRRVDEAVKADPGVEVLVGGGHYMSLEGAFLRPYPAIEVGPNIDVRRQIFDKGFMAQPSVYFRRDLYERVGGLDRKLRFCMDYELWARFSLAGARFGKIDGDISGNRWHDTSKTASQLIDLYAEVIATQRVLFGKVSPYFVQALSDHLYGRFHSKFFGDGAHLLHRWIYFKAIWVMFNARSPVYCLTGLLRHSIVKSGPLADDHATIGDWLGGVLKAVRKRASSL
jgi:glycosyltransferase involved in cell wall biosynthesis